MRVIVDIDTNTGDEGESEDSIRKYFRCKEVSGVSINGVDLKDFKIVSIAPKRGGKAVRPGFKVIQAFRKRGYVVCDLDNNLMNDSKVADVIEDESGVIELISACSRCLPDWTLEAEPDGDVCCEISNGDVRAIIAALKKASDQ